MKTCKYVPNGTGPAYWGPGDEITFFLTGEETNGSMLMVEIAVPPGGGPPPHIHHREDECFYISHGRLAIQAGERTLHVSPGDFVLIPKGTIHCFKNTGEDRARMLVTFTPAGMEKFFQEAFYPAGDRSIGPGMLTEELMKRMLTVAPNCGMELVQPS
jgi:mannose-6-phosphate isomerase-like protein (cupin superfamily)